MFEVKDLSFSYDVDGRRVDVLRELSFKVSPGEFVAIQGPSGSGKSTLFYILGFLLKPSSGQVLFDGTDITRLSPDELTLARNRRIGFVFQQFHLLSRTSALENILLPTRYPSELAQPGPEARARAERLAAQLGLGAHLEHFPNQLSGGQQQRVAIARALMNDIELILADEPTGNLDSQTAGQILELLAELNRQGKTIILITHDPEVARRCSKVYHLRDGAFTRVEQNYEPPTGARERRGPEPGAPALVESPALYRRIARAVLPLAVENLLRNKAKSLLTMLGVVIGVAAVMAMVTLGQFTKRKILETYEALGVNKLLIRGHSNWQRKATDAVPLSFTAFDWERDFGGLQRIFPEITLMSPSLSNWNDRAMAGGVEVGDGKVTLLGVTPEYLVITNRALEAGRNISPYHVASRSPVCLIGFEIAEKLFARINPLGQIVTVTDGARLNFPCQVIGVLASTTSNKEWSPPNLHVIVPYTYFQTVTDSWWNGQIHEVAVQIDPRADVEAAGKKIKSYFEQKYGKAAQFWVDSDSTLIAQMKRFLDIFAVLLTGIALLSLVVGGIGINNMMLVSVAERLKEFGIRKALGATDRSIRVQVLLESVLLCVVAGCVGVALGFGAYELMIFGATRFVPNLRFEWAFEPLAAALSVVSIIAVGIASGFVPALRAERLQVIEALRTE